MSPAPLPGSGLESLHRATLVVLTVVLTLLMMVMRMAVTPWTPPTSALEA